MEKWRIIKPIKHIPILFHKHRPDQTRIENQVEKKKKKGQTPLFKVKQTPKEIETKKSAGVSKEKKVGSRFDEKVEI